MQRKINKQKNKNKFSVWNVKATKKAEPSEKNTAEKKE